MMKKLEDNAKNILRKSGVNIKDKTTGLEALNEINLDGSATNQPLKSNQEETVTQGGLLASAHKIDAIASMAGEELITKDNRRVPTAAEDTSRPMNMSHNGNSGEFENVDSAR